MDLQQRRVQQLRTSTHEAVNGSRDQMQPIRIAPSRRAVPEPMRAERDQPRLVVVPLSEQNVVAASNAAGFAAADWRQRARPFAQHPHQQQQLQQHARVRTPPIGVPASMVSATAAAERAILECGAKTGGSPQWPMCDSVGSSAACHERSCSPASSVRSADSCRPALRASLLADTQSSRMKRTERRASSEGPRVGRASSEGRVRQVKLLGPARLPTRPCALTPRGSQALASTQGGSGRPSAPSGRIVREGSGGLGPKVTPRMMATAPTTVACHASPSALAVASQMPYASRERPSSPQPSTALPLSSVVGAGGAQISSPSVVGRWQGAPVAAPSSVSGVSSNSYTGTPRWRQPREGEPAAPDSSGHSSLGSAVADALPFNTNFPTSPPLATVAPPQAVKTSLPSMVPAVRPPATSSAVPQAALRDGLAVRLDFGGTRPAPSLPPPMGPPPAAALLGDVAAVSTATAAEAIVQRAIVSMAQATPEPSHATTAFTWRQQDASPQAFTLLAPQPHGCPSVRVGNEPPLAEVRLPDSVGVVKESEHSPVRAANPFEDAEPDEASFVEAEHDEYADQGPGGTVVDPVYLMTHLSPLSPIREATQASPGFNTSDGDISSSLGPSLSPLPGCNVSHDGLSEAASDCVPQPAAVFAEMQRREFVEERPAQSSKEKYWQIRERFLGR